MQFPPWFRPDPSPWTAIHKLGNSRFYSALAALLFAALCAYGAAALYEASEKVQPLPGHDAAGAELYRQELILLGTGSHYAALLPMDAEPTSDSCRLNFDGGRESVSAEISFISPRGAILHITSENNSLPRGFCRAELIY